MSKKSILIILLLLCVGLNASAISVLANQDPAAAGPPTPTTTSPAAAPAGTNTLASLQQKFKNNSAFNRVTTNDVNTNYIVQAAETDASNFSWLASILDWYSNGTSNDVSTGIQYLWNTTFKDFFVNIGALLQQWLKQAIMYVIEPIVQLMTQILVEYAYNPDVSVGEDTFSQQVQLLASWVRDIANDLLLLLFILSIWRYWANAAWKGGSMMGAIGRIIVAASATIAWPTIYHYVILISNAFTQYLIQQNVLNPQIISDAVAGAISKILTMDTTFSFINSLLSSGHIVQAVTLSIPIAIAQFCLVASLGLAIISSIVVFFSMKVIQIIIVVAAFVFGPFFMCLLVSSDTESTASSFIRAFIETSLWTFVWTVFLMLFVFALGVQGGADPNGALSTGTMVTTNTQNPWFILFLELGILQGMIQVPGYLSRGKISEAGQFLELFALWKMGTALGNQLLGSDGKITKAFRAFKRSPYNPFKQESTMSLGGASALPTGAGGQPLASLNQIKNSGLNAVNRASAGAGGVGVGGIALGSFGGAVPPGRGPVAASVARAQQMAGMSMGGSSLGGAAGGPAMMGGSSGAGGVVGGSRVIGSSSGSSLVGGSMGAGGGMGLGNTPVGILASAAGNALGQFSTSAAGSAAYQANSAYVASAPLIQKTTTATGANPWHDTRGRKAGPVDYLAAYNLKNIRSGEVDLKENTDHPHENMIDFDDAGQIRKLKHRKNASAAEIGMLSTVAALATMPYSDGKGHTDARAASATNNAVKDAGKWDMPLGRKMSWALSGGRVPEYARNLEKDRLEREKVKARIVGAHAYVKGESGNAYTKYLEWKFGDKMNDGTRAMLAYTSENTDATMSGFNLNYDSGIQRLSRMGMDVNPVTWGIASHEGIVAMKPSEQPQAIPAVMQLVNAHLSEVGIGPSTANWGSNMHWAAADGILRGLTPQHMRAARAIGDIAGLQYVTPQYVNKIMSLNRTTGQSEMSTSYEKVVMADLGLGRPQNFRSRP